MTNYTKQFGFSFQFTGEITRFDLFSFAMRIPTTALAGYYGPDLILTL